MADQVSQIRTGVQRAEGTEKGRIVSAAQRATVAVFVDRTRNSCQVVTGGRIVYGPGIFYQPTVLANVANDAEAACTEIFGAVVTISRFSDEAEALKIPNGGPLGLASSVWTRDPGRAMRLVSALRYGFNWVNTHGIATPEMPWTAMKYLGTGCDMSVYALDAYTAVRHIMVALD